MLCGFVGSGKTTYSRRLEAAGCVRLSVDELIFERHGRHGVDYDESEFPDLEAAALVELDQRLRDLVAAGRSVVLDYGFWSRERRDRYKRLIEDAEGSGASSTSRSNSPKSAVGLTSETTRVARTRSS